MKLKAGPGALLGQFIAICLSASMKNLLLAAALLTTAAAPALANPVHLFSINTTNPRSIDFKGTGTANFNNSTGTQNNFNVGSSTNLGVNGSINATRDYGGTSDGTLQLAGTSVMQQTIGTSGNAANVQAASQAAGLAAYTSANQFAKSATEDNFGSSFDVSRLADADGVGNVSDNTYRRADGSVLTVNDITSESQWVQEKEAYERAKFNTQYASDYATTLEQSQMVGNWKYDATKTELMALEQAEKGDYKSTYDAYSAYYDELSAKNELDLLASRSDAVTVDTSGGGSTYQKLDEGTWNKRRSHFIDDFALNNQVNQSGVSLSDFVAASGGEESSRSEQFGIISGDFKTTNSASNGSMGSHQEWIDASRAAADELMGANFDRRAEGSGVQEQTTGSGTYETTGGTAVETAADWKTQWDQAFNNAYTSKQAESTYNQSESLVTVTGVGNIANVNASGQSKFNVKLSPREIPSYEAQVAALNGSLVQSDGTVTTLGASGAAGTPVTAQPIIFPEENGSASGSSGASLGTSSYANQSNSESASAFIQAFAASQSAE